MLAGKGGPKYLEAAGITFVLRDRNLKREGSVEAIDVTRFVETCNASFPNVGREASVMSPLRPFCVI
jgi:hypothetical protein